MVVPLQQLRQDVIRTRDGPVLVHHLGFVERQAAYSSRRRAGIKKYKEVSKNFLGDEKGRNKLDTSPPRIHDHSKTWGLTHGTAPHSDARNEAENSRQR